jgi:hypothetical protein
MREVERDAFPAECPPCDAVLVGWGAYSLLRDRSHRVALLRAAREHLATDGRILLSYLERTVDGRELRWTNALANALRRVRRAAPTELGDTLAPNRLHLFARSELEEEVAAAGLRVADVDVFQHIDASTTYVSVVLAPS